MLEAALSHPCVCGHSREAHQHLRSGSDCAFCGGVCARFRASGGHAHRVGRVRSALGRLHHVDQHRTHA